MIDSDSDTPFTEGSYNNNNNNNNNNNDNKKKRPSPSAAAKYNLDDEDDSDSDDSLLNENAKQQTTFRSSKRLRKKESTPQNSHLEDALRSRSIKMETQINLHRKIQQTKQEFHLHDEALLTSARALKVQREADNQEREMEKQQEQEQQQQELEQRQQQHQHSTADGSPVVMSSRRRNNDWLEVRDTELTRGIDTQFALQLPMHRNLPDDSTRQALEYLEYILLTQQQEEEEEPAFVKTKVGKTLLKHLKNGTLDDFLVHKRLCQLENVQSLPSSVLRWMLEVAVATTGCNTSTSGDDDAALFGKLSRGAYQTLCQLWSMGKGLPTQGSILEVADLPLQLKEWFGVQYYDTTKTNKANPKSPTSVAALTTTSSISKPLAALSLIRYLHLVELAFSQKMVYVVDPPKEALEDSLVAFLLVSLDPFVFESTDTLASYQPCVTLRKILGHLLLLSSSSSSSANSKEATSDLITRRIMDHIGTDTAAAAPKLPDTQSTDKDTAWSDQARIVRLLCHTKGSCEIVALLCERLVSQNVSSSSSSSSKPSSTTTWETIQKELEYIHGWSSFAKISGVFFQLVEHYLPNQGETAVPAALVELLLEAMIMAISRLDIGVRGARQASSKTLDTASKYAFFHLLDTSMVELTVKSKALTMKNPDYLKVNYHASCVRQYTRLETQKYKTSKNQSTLDSFLRTTPTKKSI